MISVPSSKYLVERLFLIFAIIAMFFFTYNYDVHWPSWAYICVLSSMIIAWTLYKTGRVPASAAALFGWVLLSGVIAAEWRPATASSGSLEDMSLRTLGSQAMVEFLLLAGLFFTQWKWIRPALGWGLLIGGFIHSIFLFTDQYLPKSFEIVGLEFYTPSSWFYPMDAIGLLGNRSIGASFTAVWTFFACHFITTTFQNDLIKKRFLISAAGVGSFSVITSVSSISYGAIVTGGMMWAMAYANECGRLTWRLATTIIGPFVLVGMLGAVFVGPKYYNTNQLRAQAWPLFSNCWFSGCSTEISSGEKKIKSTMTPANPLIGWGAGSFKYFGPTVQDMYDFMVERREDLTVASGKYWLWAHNDWLQFMFEYGFIGLLLALLTAFRFALMSWHRPLLFGGFIAFLAESFGNYGMHIALTSVLFWWIASEIMWTKQKE